ncbi:hypothetical protein [Halobacillus sp. Marseille-Q1614]|uniref:hypothetical protein n=1 Tax=Halobacillus sp. Marseille-Q1614 TaxID=2709134 RepID=UPI00156F4CBE|nr:hypothetical protein [Halobacillus sp. Marseille-Q1614]
MKKENQMFYILGAVGIANIIAALILAVTISNPMVAAMLFVSGILLMVGGWADRRERRKRNKK